MSNPSPSQAGQSATAAPAVNKVSLIIGALGLVAIGALAAVLLLGNRTPVAESPPATQAPASALVEQAPAAQPPAAPTAEPAPTATAAATTPAPAPPVPARQSPTPPAAATKSPAPAAVEQAAAPPAPTAQPAPVTQSETAAPKPAPKAVCATCGVVASVTPVAQKGEAGALGTVAGGVVGGVLGHQVGGGTGKTVMTVVGAVGGAMAGREIEKRQRSTTVYDLRIRMDDGSTRTVTSDTALAVGQKVRVEGDKLTLDDAAAK